MIYVIGILSFIGACTIVFWGLRLLIFWSRLQDDHEEWETIDRNQRLYDRGAKPSTLTEDSEGEGVQMDKPYPLSEWSDYLRGDHLTFDKYPKRFRAAAAEFDEPGGMNAPEFARADPGTLIHEGPIQYSEWTKEKKALWDERITRREQGERGLQEQADRPKTP